MVSTLNNGKLNSILVKKLGYVENEIKFDDSFKNACSFYKSSHNYGTDVRIFVFSSHQTDSDLVEANAQSTMSDFVLTVLIRQFADSYTDLTWNIQQCSTVKIFLLFEHGTQCSLRNNVVNRIQNSISNVSNCLFVHCIPLTSQFTYVSSDYEEILCEQLMKYKELDILSIIRQFDERSLCTITVESLGFSDIFCLNPDLDQHSSKWLDKAGLHEMNKLLNCKTHSHKLIYMKYFASLPEVVEKLAQLLYSEEVLLDTKLCDLVLENALSIYAHIQLSNRVACFASILYRLKSIAMFNDVYRLHSHDISEFHPQYIGKAVIFSHETFEGYESDLSKDRSEGGSRDRIQLRKALLDLGFDVKVYIDQRKDSICDIIRDLSVNCDQCDLLLVFVMSHGCLDLIDGDLLFEVFDNSTLSVKRDVILPLNISPQLRNTIKLFCVNVCRTNTVAEVVMTPEGDNHVHSTSTGVCRNECSDNNNDRKHSAEIYSTQSGASSGRVGLGSLFIQAFTKVLSECPDMEFSQMLSRANTILTYNMRYKHDSYQSSVRQIGHIGELYFSVNSNREMRAWLQESVLLYASVHPKYTTSHLSQAVRSVSIFCRILYQSEIKTLEKLLQLTALSKKRVTIFEIIRKDKLIDELSLGIIDSVLHGECPVPTAFGCRMSLVYYASKCCNKNEVDPITFRTSMVYALLHFLTCSSATEVGDLLENYFDFVLYVCFDIVLWSLSVGNISAKCDSVSRFEKIACILLKCEGKTKIERDILDYSMWKVYRLLPESSVMRKPLFDTIKEPDNVNDSREHLYNELCSRVQTRLKVLYTVHDPTLVSASEVMSIVNVDERPDLFTRISLCALLKRRFMSTNIVVLVGIFGCGKSIAAQQYMLSLWENGNGNCVLWKFNASSSYNMERSYLELATKLGIANYKKFTDTMIEEVCLKLCELKQNKILLLFDGANDYDSIKSFVPPSIYGLQLLITSQSDSFVGKSGMLTITDTSILFSDKEVSDFIPLQSDMNTDTHAHLCSQLASKLNYMPIGVAAATSLMTSQDFSLTAFLKRMDDTKSWQKTDGANLIGDCDRPLQMSLLLLSVSSITYLEQAAFLGQHYIPLGLLSDVVSSEDEKAADIVRFMNDVKHTSLVHISGTERRRQLTMHEYIQKLLRANMSDDEKTKCIENIAYKLTCYFSKDTRFQNESPELQFMKCHNNDAGNIRYSYELNEFLLPHVESLLRYLFEDSHGKTLLDKLSFSCQMNVVRLCEVLGYFYSQVGGSSNLILESEMWLLRAKHLLEFWAFGKQLDVETLGYVFERMIAFGKQKPCLYYTLTVMSDPAALMYNDIHVLEVYISIMYTLGRTYFYDKERLKPRVSEFKRHLEVALQLCVLIHSKYKCRIIHEALCELNGLLYFDAEAPYDIVRLRNHTLKRYIAICFCEDTFFEQGKIQRSAGDSNDTYTKIKCFQKIIETLNILNEPQDIKVADEFFVTLKSTLIQFEKLGFKSERIASIHILQAKHFMLRFVNSSSTTAALDLAEESFMTAYKVEKQKNDGKGKADYPLFEACTGLSRIALRRNQLQPDYVYLDIAQQYLKEAVSIANLKYPKGHKLLSILKREFVCEQKGITISGFEF